MRLGKDLTNGEKFEVINLPSLFENEYEKLRYMEKERKPDGYGGTIETWVEGADFLGNVIANSSTEAKIAEQQGLKRLYTIVTSRSINLSYHDVIKRVSDGLIFRITSQGQDNETPKGAGLDMKSVSCEVWEIPNNE